MSYVGRLKRLGGGAFSCLLMAMGVQLLQASRDYPLAPFNETGMNGIIWLGLGALLAWAAVHGSDEIKKGA